MSAQNWMEVLLLAACLVLAGLASGTETALTSVGRLRVRYLAEQGSRAAATLQRLRADPNRFLSTVLFTNTLPLILAATATALLSEDVFAELGVPEVLRLRRPPLVSAVLSVLHLLPAIDAP